VQDSASRERVSTKALIEENGCSIVEINNAGDDPLSSCPKGVKIEKQISVAVLDKGVTIIFVLRLDLISPLTLKLHLQVTWVYNHCTYLRS